MSKDFVLENLDRRPDVTILNFATVFRGTLDDFEAVKDTISKHGAVLVYQAKSTEKIWIAKEVPK